MNSEKVNSEQLKLADSTFASVPGRHYSLEEAAINRVRSAQYIQQAGGCLEGSTFAGKYEAFLKVVPSRHA